MIQIAGLSDIEDQTTTESQKQVEFPSLALMVAYRGIPTKHLHVVLLSLATVFKPAKRQKTILIAIDHAGLSREEKHSSEGRERGNPATAIPTPLVVEF